MRFLTNRGRADERLIVCVTAMLLMRCAGSNDGSPAATGGAGSAGSAGVAGSQPGGSSNGGSASGGVANGGISNGGNSSAGEVNGGGGGSSGNATGGAGGSQPCTFSEPHCPADRSPCDTEGEVLNCYTWSVCHSAPTTMHCCSSGWQQNPTCP